MTDNTVRAGAGSYRQEDFAAPRAPFIRNRASSFDAPQQHGRPGSPGNAALVNTIPSEQQVDGIAPMSTSPRHDTHPPSPTELIHDSAAARVHPETTTSGPYSNPGLNASAPVLTHFASSPSMRPAPQAAAGRRRIAFAPNLSVHTTWPATIYDRRAEPATCNRLTPLLAQQIKEELNSFKMEEMDVHPMSRKLTHFCEPADDPISLAGATDQNPLPQSSDPFTLMSPAPSRRSYNYLSLPKLGAASSPTVSLCPPLSLSLFRLCQLFCPTTDVLPVHCSQHSHFSLASSRQARRLYSALQDFAPSFAS